ncbi:MAG: M42 family metallopeptidase [Verrucomicrobiota bacterium]
MIAPDLKTEAVRLLRELTEAHGVPGAEDAVRRIFCRELKESGEMSADRLGSVACAGKGEGPRVLVAGHFDEVGFAVQNITTKGFLKIVALGGWWTHTLVAQRVRILTRGGREILGVVGSTPPHFLGEAARDRVLPLDQLYVDIGAVSRAEAEAWGVSLGDAVAPDSAFTAMAGEGVYLAKAFDNRCGVAAAIQTMRALAGESLPCRLIAAGSVQEEVGCRGSVTLGALTSPDVALVMEGTPADDTPGMNAAESQGELGQGVQIRLLDPSAIMNRRLVDFVVDTAKAEGIPHQVAVRRSGGTDAKSLQFTQQGVPCVVLGTPARYIHSHNSLIQINDYLAAVRLTMAVARRLDVAAVAGFTDWLA